MPAMGYISAVTTHRGHGPLLRDIYLLSWPMPVML